MDHYVVCVDSVWIRNAEIFDTEGMPDDALADMGLLYDESDMDDDRKWHVVEPAVVHICHSITFSYETASKKMSFNTEKYML